MDGSYHEKVDSMVEEGRVRRKTDPMGFRQDYVNKLGKLTHNILRETAKKRRT